MPDLAYIAALERELAMAKQVKPGGQRRSKATIAHIEEQIRLHKHERPQAGERETTDASDALEVTDASRERVADKIEAAETLDEQQDDLEVTDMSRERVQEAKKTPKQRPKHTMPEEAGS